MKTQIKPAIRHFRKYPVFSLINIGGLAIGIAASFILLVYSRRELSCDRHFRDADKIARIGTDFYHMGPFASSQPMLREVLLASCKDVEDATAISFAYDLPVRTSAQDRAFRGIGTYYVDTSFFKVFSYQTTAGAIPQQGLASAEAILSETEARKFFGHQDPIGKSILVGKQLTPYKVIAVLKAGFEKSHLDPQVLLPRVPDPADFSTNWSSSAYYNYVKLKPQGSLQGLQSWLERLREKVVYPASGSTHPYTEWASSPFTVSFVVQPLTAIYFDTNMKFDLSPGGNLTQVRLLAAVSILLILLAIINYVNLVTARASTRSKEIGLKKTFGASRRQLIVQILQESTLFSLLAMFLACGLIQLILFIYQYSTGATLTGPIPFLSANYAWLILFSLAVGFLAGVYPALYLTGLQRRLTIRSTAGAGNNNPAIRNSLVTLQFVIATSLVFISLIVYAQLQYMKNKDKGFRSEGIVLVENVDALKDRAGAFQQLIAERAQVVSTSFCVRTPASNTLVMASYQNPALQKPLSIQTFPVDDHYIPTLGMRLTNGRNFNKDLLSDTNSLILNESAVAALGLFNPIGSLINGSERVIGVIKDFNYTSLHEKIGPAILRYTPTGGTLAIRLSGSNTDAFLTWLGQTGKEFLPDTPLEIHFLDENFARLAAKEHLLGQAITFFTVLAILLATLGLIGLTLFTIERRTKEIGIRKVLGAGNMTILRLIATDFIRLAAIASLIALPVSWWLVNRWLNNFAYRVSPGIGTFFITEALILLIALFVIGGLTLKAAASNPVKSLRTE
jgi:putative ABC transport system permease protein